MVLVGSPAPRFVPTTTTEVRVRYAETDQMQVVYHSNYLIWCEVGRTDFMRQHGMSYSRFINGLRQAGVDVDRKILADLAVRDDAAFAALVKVAEGAQQAS